MAIRVEPQAEIIPGYTLLERVGGGGYGEVWKAQAPGGLLKAIKIVHGDMETIGEESERADQELRALKRVTTVRHPYILSLERFDIVEGRLIIVMELADRNLWDRFRECRAKQLPGIPRDELLGYMDEAAEALDLMNIDYQLQHLDIKPQNLFLVYNHIKVADFGLVKDLRDRVAATVTGGVTPVYAAPETFDGWVSRFCDQYSLAIVYQELLTGKRPFSGSSVHQLVMQHVQEAPNLDSLPSEDREAIGHALAKVPDERFPTCKELVKALRHQPASASVANLGSDPALQVPTPPQSGGSNGTDSNSSIPTLPPGQVSDYIPPSRGDSQFEMVAGSPRPADRSDSRQIPVARQLSAPARSGSVARPAPSASVDLAKYPPDGGDGVLFPALVIGLGSAGLSTLRAFRAEVDDCFGQSDALPNARVLLIDSDSEVQGEALGPPNHLALHRNEVLLARLNRASHYLRPRRDMPRIDTWLDMAMLYRIQRSEATAGVRALGRLAFVANQRAIVMKLDAELQACSDLEILAKASESTGLGVRGQRPRVYIVAGLAGGTGSGMFIDLAYVTRDRLKKAGHPDAEIVGLFYLPNAEPNAANGMALGNAYAALVELAHFSAPEVTFSARYDDREPPLASSAAPFDRCVFLGAAPENPEDGDPARLAADFLCREMTTQLGKRAQANRAAEDTGPVACQTIGLYRYAWPRKQLLRRASRRLCHDLVSAWMAKVNPKVTEQIPPLVQARWDELDMGAQSLIMRYQEACTTSLGQTPEALFQSVTAPLTASDTVLLEKGAAGIQEALHRLEHLVGHPAELSSMSAPGVLEDSLREATEHVIRDWQPKIDKVTLELVEQPSFRLAAGEEGARCTIRLIEEVLSQHELLNQELTEKASQAYDRLQFLVQHFDELAKPTRKSAQMLGELAELLKLFPKWRYQSLILRRVNYTYTSLRGYLSDQVREIGFFRLRFGDLLANLDDGKGGKVVEKPTNRVYLLPSGCTSIDQAVDLMFPESSDDELATFDQIMQKLIRRQFRSVQYICTTTAKILRDLERAMLAEAEAFVVDRLSQTNAAHSFFERFPDGEQATDALLKGFEEAAPHSICPAMASNEGFSLLGVPAGEEEQFRKAAAHAWPQAQIMPMADSDQIFFYREDDQVSLNDLEILQGPAEEAYHQMCAATHFTPHTRLDIRAWHAAVMR